MFTDVVSLSPHISLEHIDTNPSFQMSNPRHRGLHNPPTFIQWVSRVSCIHSLLQGRAVCEAQILGTVV